MGSHLKVGRSRMLREARGVVPAKKAHHCEPEASNTPLGDMVLAVVA
jgi:hypothetical protein